MDREGGMCMITHNDNMAGHLENRRRIELPVYDPHKKNLPKRSAYIGAFRWLEAVWTCLGGSAVFALDNALICEDLFLGRSHEYLVWLYGDDSVTQYNGVVMLGKNVDPNDVEERRGIRYTRFCRTLNDAIEHEQILDMQGITEALSRYYFENGETFDGLEIAPGNRNRFELLARDAMEYYNT